MVVYFILESNINGNFTKLKKIFDDNKSKAENYPVFSAKCINTNLQYALIGGPADSVPRQMIIVKIEN